MGGSDGRQIGSCLGRRRNGKDARKLLWVLGSFIILTILVISSQVWNMSNAHKTCQIAHLKHTQFALCQLYCNKAIKILWRWSFCVLWEGRTNVKEAAEKVRAQKVSWLLSQLGQVRESETAERKLEPGIRPCASHPFSLPFSWFSFCVITQTLGNVWDALSLPCL